MHWWAGRACRCSQTTLSTKLCTTANSEVMPTCDMLCTELIRWGVRVVSWYHRSSGKSKLIGGQRFVTRGFSGWNLKASITPIMFSFEPFWWWRWSAVCCLMDILLCVEETLYANMTIVIREAIETRRLRIERLVQSVIDFLLNMELYLNSLPVNRMIKRQRLESSWDEFCGNIHGFHAWVRLAGGPPN